MNFHTFSNLKSENEETLELNNRIMILNDLPISQKPGQPSRHVTHIPLIGCTDDPVLVLVAVAADLFGINKLPIIDISFLNKKYISKWSIAAANKRPQHNTPLYTLFTLCLLFLLEAYKPLALSRPFQSTTLASRTSIAPSLINF